MFGFCFQVLVPKDENLMGKLVQVKITETGKHFMKCDLLTNISRPDVPLPLKKGQVSGVTMVSVNISALSFNVTTAKVCLDKWKKLKGSVNFDIRSFKTTLNFVTHCYLISASVQGLA